MPDVELESIDMNMIWVYYELKLMYPHIMKKLYEELPTLEESPKSTKYRYLNPTVVINVNLENESVPEYAFICLGRTRGTKSRIIQYYVSEEYLVGDGSFSRNVGRFMFTITDDDQVNVSLFAEEPARILTSVQYNIEHLYLQARENKEPGIL